MTQPIVIVGSGLAGWSTARELRKQGCITPIQLICADSGDFYAKPALSNALAQRKTPAQLVTTPAAKMAAQLDVQLLAHTRVQGMDRAAHTLSLEGPGGSKATATYSRLVLATGAHPIRVPVAGDAAPQVLAVNNLEDFSRFFRQLTETCSSENSSNKKAVLIMGAGLIGCEFANDLAAAGHAVQVVDPGARPLAALLSAADSAGLRTALERLGVRFHLGTTVQRLDADPAGGVVARLAQGDQVRADVVLSAVGLRADTALAQAAGLHVERGICVNLQLQTSDPHVFAIGDAAQYPGEGGGRTLPFVAPILHASKVLAHNLMHDPIALVFPPMQVTIKTPAYPLKVAA